MTKINTEFCHKYAPNCKKRNK